MRNICDSCAGEPATIDHLDLSGAEAVLKRLCKPCAEVERQQWNAERLRRPMAPMAGPVSGTQLA